MRNGLGLWYTNLPLALWGHVVDPGEKKYDKLSTINNQGSPN